MYYKNLDSNLMSLALQVVYEIPPLILWRSLHNDNLGKK
jgi:hypothetical protein